jgi:peptide/nickel transport system substrate-binding protein
MIGAFPLKVFLAGRVAVETNGVVSDEERFQGRQGRLFFAYLGAEQGRAVPRDELAEALWGSAPPASWDKSLTVIASKLRNLLAYHGLDGANALTGAFGCYRLELPEGTWVDVIVATQAAQEAEDALAAGDLEQAKTAAALAASLVRQPFLPGEEGTWVEEKRRGLADVRGRALSALADAYLRSGDAPEAAKWAEQTVALEPFRETGYRRLMEAHVAAGNRGEALRVYEQCRTLLADELGSYPSPETESIYRALLDAPSLAPPVTVKTEPAAILDGTETRRPAAIRARRRSGVPIAIGAVLLLTAASAVAGIELTGGDSPGLSSASANSAAAIDASSNRLVAEVTVGNGPTSVAIGEGSVWVTNALDRTVSRIDPRTGSVLQRIDVGRDPSGIAFGGGAVWVANSSDGTVSEIDPQTNHEVQAITVGVTPTAVAFGEGAVWVTSAAERSVTKIVRGRVVDKIQTGALGRGIAVGGGSVWVTDESSRSVVRIDARTNQRTETVSVGNGPTGVAFGRGSVWVANSLDGTVSRIDPRRNTVTATIEVGEGPDAIAVEPDAVWVSVEFSEAIARIDPARDQVVEKIQVANRPKGLALLGNRVWFAVQASGSGHRGGRLVVGAHELFDGSIDPTFWTWAGTGDSLLSTTYDGLVGFVRRGGSEGGRIVPNLAKSLPVITDGETRYAFQLGAGVRYSNGALVKASDFRRAIERLFHAGMPWEVPLVGVDACRKRPRTCDHSRGIQTDDATGTIVFHLRRPEAEFLSDLSFLVPIPEGTPDHDLGTRPVPSTGPYKIETYVPGRALTLVRNPYFRVRSRAARPDGFPDEIEFRLDRSSGGVTSVARGRADVAFASDQPEGIRMLEGFKLRHASQVHVQAVQATVGIFLNTTKPPFGDVRVRRAVNYAVDRTAISASSGGPEFAQLTCQPRPPGTVGFRRYCPYTAATSQTGEWKAPDLTRARRLVAASGTRGMRVTVWTFPGFWEPAAKGAVRALEELGYRANIGRAENLDAYIAKVTDVKTRGVQAGVFGWWNVPRAASSLLASFRCSPPDGSFLCDRRVDAQIARAQRVGAIDSDAAVALWGRIERDIVDLAPWVPLFTPSGASVVSKRVGNYQDNPELGILFDQLWVR